MAAHSAGPFRGPSCQMTISTSNVLLATVMLTCPARYRPRLTMIWQRALPLEEKGAGNPFLGPEITGPYRKIMQLSHRRNEMPGNLSAENSSGATSPKIGVDGKTTYPFQENAGGICWRWVRIHDRHGTLQMPIYQVGLSFLNELICTVSMSSCSLLSQCCVSRDLPLRNRPGALWPRVAHFSSRLFLHRSRSWWPIPVLPGYGNTRIVLGS